MKPFKIIGAGFLFGVGCLPAAVFAIWLFHNWPLWSSDEVAGEFLFDTTRIELSPVQLARSADGMLTGLAEARNTSERDCGFLQLDCDLMQGGKLLSHEMAVISGLKAGTSRGFTLIFSSIPTNTPLGEITVKLSIAQAFDGDLMKPGE